MPNPTSAARSTNPFDPTEEEDAVDPETQDESLKEQQCPFGYPTGRDFEQDVLTHVCTQVLQVGTEFQAWQQAEGITNVATLLSYDIDDYTTSGFDIPWRLCKMICALAHWYPHDPSAINEGDERLFFLTRKDLQCHMVTVMRPKGADEISQAVSTAENDPVGGPNDFIDPAIDPAGNPAAGTTVPDDITVPTGTTVPGDVIGDVTDDVNVHVTTRGIPGLTPAAQRRLTHLPSPTTRVRHHTSSRLLEPTQLKPNFFSSVLLCLDGLLYLLAGVLHLLLLSLHPRSLPTFQESLSYLWSNPSLPLLLLRPVKNHSTRLSTQLLPRLLTSTKEAANLLVTTNPSLTQESIDQVAASASWNSF